MGRSRWSGWGRWSHYRFRTVWALDAPPDRVFAVLERAQQYPEWWPQVRQVAPLDAHTGTARFRSLLPYDLEVTVRAARTDPAAGVLEIAMTGDLEGFSRWTVGADGLGGTQALHEQEVEVRKPLMRALALPGRPLFLANHALMMRAGRRGLRDRLGRGLEED